jgi:glycosyltransferase involved in cell wall biosynthesis
VHYAVLSTHELETVPRTWGIPRERVHFVPFCCTIDDLHPATGGRGVFAGGNSLRDYRPLLAAAPAIRAPVTIATSLQLGNAHGVAAGALAPDVYLRRADEAAVVVVPLLADTVRSGGQQTYLNAMMRGKPVVVTDAPGVRDYIRDGETGVIVAPDDAGALAAAVNRLLEDQPLARRIGQAARADVLARFRVSDYLDRLLGLAERLCAAPSQAATPTQSM